MVDFEQIVLRTRPDGTRLRLGKWRRSSTALRRTTANRTSTEAVCPGENIPRREENAIAISEIVQGYIVEAEYRYPKGII
ncbi:MAG: hypothetical protein Ct9H300mP32_6330 [Verrucomicrobiota bacterium]|nr:MAG: hypothetical protein Ct9H300mP32_6330 [Verrucomicrobiota bacterium]